MLLTNGDNRNVSEFGAVFSATGIDEYAFIPSTSPNMLAISDWPTYGELISAGKRLVMFLDYGADQNVVEYILDEVCSVPSQPCRAIICLCIHVLTTLQFTYFFETPYDTTDPSFPECTLDRPPNGSPDGRMIVVNHFLDSSIFGLDVPDDGRDFSTNAATGNGSIGDQAALCTAMYGRVPNVILVDMFDRGDVFTAQNTLNGV